MDTRKYRQPSSTSQALALAAMMLSAPGAATRLRREREHRLTELATKTGLDAATVAELTRKVVG